MSRKRLFNDDWFFTKQKPDTPVESIRSGEISWEPVEIPHDWLIDDTHHLYETGEGWYRKNFNIPFIHTDEKYLVRFEGVYMDSSVYINGHWVGDWKYGYSTFEWDITAFLVPGDNDIVVRVVHHSPNSRWYSGSGIYRNVWLINKKTTCFISDGIYISTKEEKSNWTVDVATEIMTQEKKDLFLLHIISDPLGKTVAEYKKSLDDFGNHGRVQATLTVKNPLIWDIHSPSLYTLKSELIIQDTVIDTEIQCFGFRSIEFHPDHGFILNGKKLKLHGVCQHHDLGALGSAVNKTAIRRQFSILKEMGANAIRTAHNMPAVEFMELADEMGFLVVSEAFDMWEKPKTDYDYARFFKDWVDKDVASWIRRDRNHPSVIMWSIGNEVHDTHVDENGQKITKMLMELVLKHDPNRNAWPTLASNYMPWENTQKCADMIKLVGYNYSEKYYDLHHKIHPDWIIYGSETASTTQSRGIYHFPLSQSVLSDDDLQCSSLGNSTTSWGAKNPESCIIADRDTPYSPGQFIWSGFDYIGEPTPYATKNSYLGQIDTAGFKKDSFYIYQAEWTDYKTNPMIHIFPYWDFSEGQLIDVRVCSNAPRIELFFNDISCGSFDIDHKNGKKLLGDWQIPYSKGTLRAVAYDENGIVIAEDMKSSFGNAIKLLVTPDKTVLNADGRDLSFIEISSLDSCGIPVENANNRVNITVEGPGRLIGLDNGDSTDYDQYKGTGRRLFSGKLLAIIGSTYTAGEVSIHVASPGMETQTIRLRSVPCNYPEGLSHTLAKNKPSEASKEIPVRKIELVSPYGNQLNRSIPSVTIEAKLLPENATYRDIEWRVTDEAGIDSNLATIEANGNTAILSAIGDGKVCLRCATRNGQNHIDLYSQIDFSITGFGKTWMDPYGFIAGGQYNASNKELGNGNDRGVATLRNEESHVGFKGIQFGERGSDTITLPIFALESGNFPIEIWEGMPGETGSEQVTTVIYTKGSKWNTYLEQTFQLPRRFKGITAVCFVVRRKIHIKGFRFKKIEKAYEKLYANENNQIYGDSFHVTQNAVEDIGNNVTIEFEDMDFGEKGFNRIGICGCTNLSKNTIHIRFTNGAEDIRQIVEFPFSPDYTEYTFPLESVTGKQKVTFIFLPGSQFNFKWFRFYTESEKPDTET